MADNSAANDSKGSAKIMQRCPELKEKYTKCFNSWFSEKFLRGQIMQDCQQEWEDYKDCVQLSLAQKNLEYIKTLDPMLPTTKQQQEIAARDANATDKS
eukprot:TRINITY_DN1731_c0_g1_i1.p1 TRINITY_DN1731_c0_g1~~TRINITY_DN1731_c0_g1_i1.p1  ORF type:complete len:99 (-),score=8.52 TRINITY_DN1731_c0_g1_i1:44-340(-)